MFKTIWSYVTSAHDWTVKMVATYPTVTLWTGFVLIVAVLILF